LRSHGTAELWPQPEMMRACKKYCVTVGNWLSLA
jgi:hypothetical protein